MPTKRLLVIDDEAGMRAILCDLLQRAGYEVFTASDGKEGVQKAEENPDLVILDLSLPRMGGIEVLSHIKSKRPDTPVIVITAYASMRTAVQALKGGAYDYITKPFDIAQVEAVVYRALQSGQLMDENRYLWQELKRRYNFENIIGTTVAVQHAYLIAAKVADSNASVLILGETGTGKEFLAKTIHYESCRSSEAFLKVNCAALPEALLESELFGHEKGAFTNAVARHLGRFELAHKGTLFLDEVGDIPLPVQVKLLRVLQEKEFERVGGSETLSVDARIIAATHQDLVEAMKEGTFREDLYYRLNVIPIYLPPLRERREDIPLLAEHFVRKSSREQGRDPLEIAPDAFRRLQAYQWPGNIRELENCIERACLLAQGPVLSDRDLHMGEAIGRTPPHVLQATSSNEEDLSLQAAERVHIRRVLDKTSGNQSRAAELLRIDRKTLRNKMREYGFLELASQEPAAAGAE
ncbi:MAG TPA: sigma-54 dependent transcriptional regulator [Armatimonadota bacterium]|jgi:DNA-binding NtrC family response regulator